jgi:hypothetical protein
MERATARLCWPTGVACGGHRTRTRPALGSYAEMHDWLYTGPIGVKKSAVRQIP